MELRSDINALLRKANVPQPNLTRQERIGLAQLRNGKDRVILTVDREEYVSKVQELLADSAYRSIPRDPTNRIKAQLIIKLRKIEKDNNLDEGMYKAMYPTGCIPPVFNGLAKIHKQAILSDQ